MKTLLASLVLIFAVNASADVINCSFTEPFYNIEINTEAKTLSKIEPDFESEEGGIITTVLSKNIEIKKLESTIVSSAVEIPRYQVIVDGVEGMILDLDYKGSDGMSDFVYPYSTKHGENFGGCQSDKVKRLNSNYEDSTDNTNVDDGSADVESETTSTDEE